MSERIEVGDLVVVVRGNGCSCSLPSISIGRIFLVRKIEEAKKMHCNCGLPLPGGILAEAPGGNGYQLWRLRRIPPLTEPETTETKDEVNA